MKTLLLSLTLSTVFGFSAHAGASEQFYELRGAQLASFSFQAIGEKKAELTAEGIVKIVKTANGSECRPTGQQGTGGCYLSIRQKNNLLINDFYWEQYDVIHWEQIDKITNQQIEEIKNNASVEGVKNNQDTFEQLYNIKNETTFTKDGSCYVYVLRFWANPNTKKISRLSWSQVAHRCP